VSLRNKKKEFSSLFLKSIYALYVTWNFIPSSDYSGGILIDFNCQLFSSIAWHIGKFSITVFLENKSDKIKWSCTTMYGHVQSNLKYEFWEELIPIGVSWSGPWVIGGDFNVITSRNAKRGVSFDNINMLCFNFWIDAFALEDLKCSDRKYTWARGGRSSQMAYLDRFFINSSWSSLCSTSHSFSFPRIGSDHSLICLEFGLSSQFKSSIFRFEQFWISQEGFSEFLANWWNASSVG
jgi:hypothetical protein